MKRHLVYRHIKMPKSVKQQFLSSICQISIQFENYFYKQEVFSFKSKGDILKIRKSIQFYKDIIFSYFLSLSKTCIIKHVGLYVLFLFSFSVTSCESFVDVGSPTNRIDQSLVFTNNATATAAIYGIYNQMTNPNGFSSGGGRSMSVIGGLSSDDLNLYSASLTQQKEFYLNTISATNTLLSSSIWGELYQYIYKSNAMLEGLENSSGVSQLLKNQLMGEAKFIRAFSYFYLVNLFGEVPMVITTDYRVNASIPRTSITDIYKLIIADLKASQVLLQDNYSLFKEERVRINKFASIALLSRVYLYLGDWNNAEVSATEVINNTTTYTLLSDLNSVFLKNSKEAIWQLSQDNSNTADAITHIFKTNPVTYALSQNLITNFEPGDLRRSSWIGSTTVGIANYYFPNKYKVTATTPISEYSMVLRLGEQYLIRAEARINQPGKISGGIEDLNLLRKRARALPTSAVPNPLPALSSSLSKEEALLAIERERRVELFTEWGHRWLDLKRTNRANATMGIVTPQKGGAWKPEWQLYPIPQVQILNDPAMTNAQNPGYN
ncbi:RagB/SusD family nutrient uptake outer membrane protein [Chitinophaga niabensis]|uniref:RagB/SusD family nutrient uptake outer membrane protein n=1 Tax=Chitinophaga niabensis TaxID=536979 RepID=UPI0031BB6514